MIKTALSLFLAFALVACATGEWKQRADQARAGYAGVVTAFDGYAKLPRCTPVQPAPCSQQSTVNAMRQVDDALDAATKAAQAAPSATTVGAAEAKLTEARALAAANPGGK